MGSDGEVAEGAPVGVDDPAKEKQKRDRSQIEFPYSDLESTADMVRTLHQRAGTSCEDVQLAAWMNQTATGGGFRSRLSAGRMFGLIETSGQQVTITPLGLDAIDDERGPASRAEAFLNVALFRAMYDQFKGYALPPPAALERQMEALGVAPKQKDRARQAFTKSAQYAGYIDGQTGRFTKPAFAAAPAGSGKKDERSDDEDDGAGGGGSGGNGGGRLPRDLHPFIVGLLHELPAAKTDWAVDKRIDWLTAAATMFKLIYKGDGNITISREADPKSQPSKENGG